MLTLDKLQADFGQLLAKFVLTLDKVRAKFGQSLG